MEVSIHAPYAGSDDCTHAVIDGVRQFQSTPPMQGATGTTKASVSGNTGFNPRPLCRERRQMRSSRLSSRMFQSTPPMQGATDLPQ